MYPCPVKMPVPFNARVCAERGITQLEVYLANHAAFDAWLEEHNK